MRNPWQRVSVDTTAVAAHQCRGGGSVNVVDGIPPLQHPLGSDWWLGFCGQHSSTTNVCLLALRASSFIWRCMKRGPQPRMDGFLNLGMGLGSVSRS
jgi:hypothetical protein